MIDPENVPAVTEDEGLARFVLNSRYVSSGVVKQEAFIPRPYRELSVTRHLSATEEELWSVGKGVAEKQAKTLYGRADVSAAVCLLQNLVVKADPILDNPNHAEIGSWPVDKPGQKAIALELAAVAKFVPFVDSTS